MEALKKQSRAVSAHSLMTGMFKKSESIKPKSKEAVPLCL